MSTRQLALPLRYLSAIKRHPNRLVRVQSKVICLLCFWFLQKPKAVQTVKLTLVIGTFIPTSAIYRHSIRRNEPNRPHISSVIHQCQRAKHPEPKTRPKRQSLSATAQPKPPNAHRLSDASQPSLRLVSAVPSVPATASAAPVKGYLRIRSKTCNPHFEKTSHFRSVSSPS